MNARNLTLQQRTKKIIEHQRAISNILEKWDWVLTDRSKTLIDIRNDDVFEPIYKEAKSGMNAKRAKIIRYKPDDIPDIQSSCFFTANKNWNENPLTVHHKIGYNGKFSETEYIIVDNFESDLTYFNYRLIYKLVLETIEFYKPDWLYILGDENFRKLTKSESNTPWTGWYVYLKNNIKCDFKKVNFCKVNALKEGVLFETTNEELFNSQNSAHVKTALKLEEWFIEQEVRLR